MEFGLAQGLSVNGQFDQKINDLRYREQEDRRSKAEAEAKAKLFADDLQYNSSGNEFDSKLVKEYAVNSLKKIGEYQRQNPDLLYNPEKLIVFNQMKRDLKDNEHSRRMVASDTAYRDYLKDMSEVAKNPNQYDTDAYQGVQGQWQNYLKYGNQDGEEAAKAQGKKAFLYSKPQDFVDLNEIHRKSADSFNPNQIQYINNGRDRAYNLTVNPKDIRNEAITLYNAHKRQYDVQYGKQGINPIDGIVASMKPYIKNEYYIGEKNRLADEMALAAYKQRLKDASDSRAAGSNVDPYKAVVIDSNYQKADPEDLAKTFGTNVPYYYRDNSGKLVNGQGDDFHYDGDIFDKEYKKDAKGNVLPYKKDGIKTTPGFVYKGLDWGRDQGFLKKSYGVFGDLEVKPEFKDRVEIVETPPNSKGETEKIVKLKAYNNVNANSPDYAGKFNSRVATTKQRNEIGIDDNFLDQMIYQDRNGNQFIKDLEGNPIPYK